MERRHAKWYNINSVILYERAHPHDLGYVSFLSGHEDGGFKLFHHMLQALGQHGLYVAVSQRVEDGLALPAVFYQMHLL